MVKNGKTTLEKIDKLMRVIYRDVIYIKKNIITKENIKQLKHKHA